MGLILVSFVDPGEQNRGAQAFVLVSGWGGGGVSSENKFFFFLLKRCPITLWSQENNPLQHPFLQSTKFAQEAGRGRGGGEGVLAKPPSIDLGIFVFAISAPSSRSVRGNIATHTQTMCPF